MTVETAQPVRKQVTVRVPQARAFEVVTTRIGEWWHPDHSIGGEPIAGVVVARETCDSPGGWAGLLERFAGVAGG